MSQVFTLDLLFSGFSYGVRQQDISHVGPKDAQLAMPPLSSSSSVFESSQSQQFSSVQQSSSSFSQSQSSQSTNQIYESQEFNGGVMKGYKMKEEFSSEQSGERTVRDSGIFTGINGDSNALVDEEFDRKKHTVKDLAKHFALVKPKQNIPHNILPEQRIYNGDHGPALNYLGASEADGQVHSLVRREMSQQDVEASKAAYEMKKKQQMEQQQQSSTTSTTTSSSSTVVKRTETSSRSEQEAKSERRMSLRDSLMLDPAQAHADAGIIDPSAILRGEAAMGWSPPAPATPRAVASSPSCPASLYKSQTNGSGPRSRVFAPVKFSTLPRSSVTLPPLPSTQPTVTPPTLVEPTKAPSEERPQISPMRQTNDSSFLSPPNILPAASFSSDYEATVLSSSKSFDPPPAASSAPVIVLEEEEEEEEEPLQHTSLDTAPTQSTTQTHQELAVSLSFPEVSRSSAPTPAPTTPFPCLDSLRPRTPILVTTRPSSVILDSRTRHVSKDDIAKMMAELNEPLPPMLDIPQEIRASPLIFAGGLATVSHPSSSSSTTSTSCLLTTSTSTSSSSTLPVRLIHLHFTTPHSRPRL